MVHYLRLKENSGSQTTMGTHGKKRIAIVHKWKELGIFRFQIKFRKINAQKIKKSLYIRIK